MKNLLLGMAAFLMLSFNLNAQNYSHSARIFKKGRTDIQIGYGFLTSAAILDKATTKLPPLSIRADRFLSDNFSLGVAYTVSSHESQPFIVPDGIEQRITNTTHQLVVRPTFHVTTLNKADLYGGFQVGVNFESFSLDKGDFTYLEEHMNMHPQNTKMAYGAFVGGRYIMCKKWSAYGEIGLGSSLLTVGFGYRI